MANEKLIGDLGTYAVTIDSVEVLTGMDDRRYMQEYDVVGELPLPAYNVVGAMRLHPIGDGQQTLVERTLSYETPLPKEEAGDFERTRYVLLADSLDLLAKLFD